MRKFRFRLQSILDLREYVEQQRKLDLGKIAGTCSVLQNQISVRDSERDERLSTIPDAERNNVMFRRSLEQYAYRLSREGEALSRELALREKDRALSADRFAEAKRDADVLRKLREHREDAHRRDDLRSEHLVLDEVSRNIFLRDEVNDG